MLTRINASFAHTSDVRVHAYPIIRTHQVDKYVDPTLRTRLFDVETYANRRRPAGHNHPRRRIAIALLSP